MSLLLEARKKAQSIEANRAASADGLRLENPPSSATDNLAETNALAREAGQNLFSAKSPVTGHIAVNPYLLSALGGTILLLAVGAAYWWYLDSSGDMAPQRPIAPATTQPIQVVAVPESQNTEIPDTEPAEEEASFPVIPPEPAPTYAPRQHSPVHIEPQRTQTIDPLLHDAYLAYRSGKTDEARQLYQAMLAKDERQADALLGLAAIAQQRGDNLVAAQYYSHVLMLDPRNAVANAGMSALHTGDDGNESRLKTLLREQNNSAALHFALGNLYAGQSRWSEAQQAYFNAWTLESDNTEFAYNLAVSLDHLGQSSLAARYYQRALQLDATSRAGFDHAQVARRIEALERSSR